MQIENKLKTVTQNPSVVDMHSQQHLQDQIGEVNFVGRDITVGLQEGPETLLFLSNCKCCETSTAVPYFAPGKHSNLPSLRRNRTSIHRKRFKLLGETQPYTAAEHNGVKSTTNRCNSEII